MRQYNIVQPLWMAFYAKSLYRDVHQHWRKFAYTYLLFLVLLCALPSGAKLYNTAHNTINNIGPWIAQLPTISLKNREVSIDKPEPFLIKYPGTDKLAIVVDTTGKITTLEEANTTFLITKDAVITSDTLPKLGFIILMFPLSVGLSFLQGMGEAAVYALLAKLFIKTPLPYREVYQLGLVAITPKYILVTLLGILGITFPFKWILYFALGLGYLLFAIEANRN